MMAVRERIIAAYGRNGVRFRTSWRAAGMSEHDITRKLIDGGVMDVGVGPEGAEFGRSYSNRPKPW